MTALNDPRLRLLLVHDCTLHREGLATRFAVDGADVRMAWDLPSLCAELARGLPDVILLNMGTRNSSELLRKSVQAGTNARVIVLGVSEDDESVIVSCAEAGVSGYHLRSESLEELRTLILRVADGESVCSPRVSGVLLRRLSDLASQGQTVGPDLILTAREEQILQMLEMGLSNREIALRLCIAVHTVKNHVHSVLTKLGVRSRAEAASWARNSSSVSPATAGLGGPLRATGVRDAGLIASHATQTDRYSFSAGVWLVGSDPLDDRAG
jgi:DNA-binding NarL/FixJ family response regulator